MMRARLLTWARVAALAVALAACGDRGGASGSDTTAAGGTAQGDTAAAAEERVPREFVARGACPFECCVYGEWTLRTDATLRESAARSSEIVTTLTEGTTVRADSGMVIVRPGLLVMTRTSPRANLGDTVTFQPGDTVELLDYVGEGFRRVRWHGRELQVEEFWRYSDSTAARVLREPEQHWWAYFTHPSSQRRGWVLMDSVRVRGADACG